ncbi:MAG TPA: DUF262 domain-containing protein, partial [Candidatus Kapabacteria bacterium]|nr:DUF262 domain-containing protein [Candidatus Kapabacteria bacterium]
LKTIFDSFTLPIVCVETNDLDIIDDMFTRLNEGAPLNAAEKRNAIGGPMTTSINKVASQKFFTECVKFSNKRYQHREVAARLLFIVASQKNNQEIVDTKKAFLDAFVKSMKKQPKLSKEYEEAVASVLKKMHSAFHKQDPLLRSQSNVPIYFLLFDDMRKQGGKTVKREILSRFAGAVASNRETAEKDLSSADPALLEFERLSIQGTNDASSIKRRFEILKKYVSFHQSSNKKKEGSLQLTHK